MGFFSVLVGALLVGFGLACVAKNYVVTNNLKEFRFIYTLGGGNEYTGVKFLGIICIFIGFTVIFGIWGAVLNFLFSGYTGLLKS